MYEADGISHLPPQCPLPFSPLNFSSSLPLVPFLSSMSIRAKLSGREVTSAIYMGVYESGPAWPPQGCFCFKP